MIEIERMWSELQNNTQIIYSDFIKELMSGVDERALIHKKREYRQQGIKLRTHIKSSMAIVTTLGQITYSRYLLIPYPDSKEALMKAHGVKSVAPLDCYSTST